MSKEFRRLKRYNATWTMLRAVALGVAVTLLAAGIVMLMDKMHVMTGNIVYYVIAAVLGLVIGAIYWVLQRRNDLHLAEKIDEEHHLRERVQTMVEYRDADGAMLQVQREDTERRLQAVRKFGQKKLTLGAHLLLVLVALAVFMVGVVMPVQAVPQPTKPTEPPFEASEWQKAGLEELIKHVENSDMIDTAKEPVVEELWELRHALDTKLTTKNVQLLVVEVIRFTYAITDEVNSNDDIHDLIERKVTHDQADELAYALGAINNKEREADIALIGETLAKDEQLPSLKGLAIMLEDALSDSIFDETDPLYAAVAQFAAKLHGVSDAESTDDLETARNLLGVAINELKNDANNALTQQDLTKDECMYVVDQLCKIFEIPNNMRPADPDENYSQGANKEYNESGGGLGTGEMQYAGKDEIYDHETDSYIPYGDLLTERYFPLMRQKLQDGTLPEALVEFIKSYYNELQTGNNLENGENPETP